MIKAKVIADTVNPACSASRITTFEVTAPRIILAEVNTHGVIAKSAASSRAIPVAKRIEMIETAPFIPKAFGKNKPGMQAGEDFDDVDTFHARRIWQDAVDDAVRHTKRMLALNAHKQHANRIAETFTYYTGVLTGTEWDNFFKLRLHPDAQPEFQDLAQAMKEAMDASTPREERVHLPYVDDQRNVALQDAFSVSAARCARVSYKTFAGKVSTIDDDRDLCHKLITGGHMSPFDHPAWADRLRNPAQHEPTMRGGKYVNYWFHPELHGRYWGWIPHRVEIEPEKSRRSSWGGVTIQ